VTSDQLTDGRGLAVSTNSVASAMAYARGVDLLLESSPDAESALRNAVKADPHFDLARVALACALARADKPAKSVLCDRSLGSAAIAPTRRERQHIEVIRLVLSGERDRAAVLGREHLREFPSDILVAHVLTSRGLA
jgi:hypothetical protein